MSETTDGLTPKLGWVIVYVDDVPAALDLYERAFGLQRTLLVPGDSYGELSTGETTLAFANYALGEGNFDGGVRRGDDGAPPNVELALVYDDVDAAFERAVREGCTALAPPAEKPQGQRVSYVRDPFGTLVEVASPLR